MFGYALGIDFYYGLQHVSDAYLGINMAPAGLGTRSMLTVIPWCNALPSGAGTSAVEVDIPEAEREAFELWLRDLWREKDRLMGRFLDTGSLDAPSASGKPVEITVPLRLKHGYEVLDAFCFFVPAVAGWAWSKVR